MNDRNYWQKSEGKIPRSLQKRIGVVSHPSTNIVSHWRLKRVPSLVRLEPCCVVKAYIRPSSSGSVVNFGSNRCHLRPRRKSPTADHQPSVTGRSSQTREWPSGKQRTCATRHEIKFVSGRLVNPLRSDSATSACRTKPTVRQTDCLFCQAQAKRTQQTPMEANVVSVTPSRAVIQQVAKARYRETLSRELRHRRYEVFAQFLADRDLLPRFDGVASNRPTKRCTLGSVFIRFLVFQGSSPK
ncbi:hypothetical protein Q31b_34990 [Novipirellula aureliae]|uniref:Uncharacterized protein n=1 Tax=Novipirellula aureliae TaxID=2527966 RepID=A0A5C6DV45_9BACT|nr:hypothetical protein Q31b_34990 [Novipirellula aureliae]